MKYSQQRHKKSIKQWIVYRIRPPLEHHSPPPVIAAILLLLLHRSCLPRLTCPYFPKTLEYVQGKSDMLHLLKLIWEHHVRERRTAHTCTREIVPSTQPLATLAIQEAVKSLPHHSARHNVSNCSISTVISSTAKDSLP